MKVGNKTQEHVEQEWSKGRIFDIFYKRQDTNRSGGGMTKKKMCRQKVSIDNIDCIESILKGHKNSNLIAYFTKLKGRSSKIAPPPRPKN